MTLLRIKTTDDNRREGLNYSILDNDVSGVEVFSINRSFLDYDRHFHDAYMVGFVKGGAGHTLEKNKTESLASPGEVALLNPGVVHSGMDLPRFSGPFF